jgi:hypothetical protein
MLEMGIGIFWGHAVERALLHHIDESWFEFKIVISDARLWSNSDTATNLKRKSVWVLVAVVIPKTCQQYLRRVILKILVKKTLIEISLSGILDPNGNWPVG